MLYTLNNAAFRYGTKRVLEGIDLEIASGEILGVLGPNGSGKTTLLKILGGLLHPTEGRVRLDSSDLSEMPHRERARRIGMVPQEHPVAFPYTALEIVLMARYPHLRGWAFESEMDRRIARAAMEQMEVEALADRLFGELSGGERQRVIIARALAQEPLALLLDEPTAFLDLHHQTGIHRILRDLNRTEGKTIVIVSHDLNLAAQLCGRMIVLNEGRIVADGAPREVITERLLSEIYRCRASVDRHPETGGPRVTLLS